jgi:hypothetical protein
MRSRSWLVAVLCAAAGCAGVSASMTARERGELAPALETPLSIEVDAAGAHAAWGRAQFFVQNVAGARVRTASDFVIDTQRIGCRAHYSAERLPLEGDRARITVRAEECTGVDRDSAEQLERDAHVFAYFVKTGKLACDRGGTSACLTVAEPPTGPIGCPGIPDPNECAQGRKELGK